MVNSKKIILNLFYLKIFNVFLDILLNIVSIEQNLNMNILYKKEFKSSPTSI